MSASVRDVLVVRIDYNPDVWDQVDSRSPAQWVEETLGHTAHYRARWVTVDVRHVSTPLDQPCQCVECRDRVAA